MTKGCCCKPSAGMESWIICPAKRNAIIAGISSISAMLFGAIKFYPESTKKPAPMQNTSFSEEDEFSDVNLSYKPFALNIEQTQSSNVSKTPTIQIMIGDDDKNNLLIADPKGSQIWAKGGLNFIQANKGDDVFYFSLCSTKVIDNQVSIIKDFDREHDVLNFFCSKYHIQSKDINIKHINHLEEKNTCIEVKGATDTSVVCLIGDISLQPGDIIITTLGNVMEELGLEA